VAEFFSSVILQSANSPLIIASTGASAMLMFGSPHALVSRPWNLIGGHSVSAIMGVTCFYLITNTLLATSIAIPLSLVAMHFLRCMHPLGKNWILLIIPIYAKVSIINSVISNLQMDLYL
jgi:CBS domain-containing membrane protein